MQISSVEPTNALGAENFSMKYNFLTDKMFISKGTESASGNSWLHCNPTIERNKWITLRHNTRVSLPEIQQARPDVMEKARVLALRNFPDNGLNASVQYEVHPKINATTGEVIPDENDSVTIRAEERIYVGEDGVIKTLASKIGYELENLTWGNNCKAYNNNSASSWTSETYYTSNNCYYGHAVEALDPTKFHRLQRNAPGFLMGSRRPLGVRPGPEERARALLHGMIGEASFRRYLKDGFISYRAKSGKVYQIPGEGMVSVWNQGKIEQKLCLVFQDPGLPPTDSVIMRLLILEHDESEFIRLAKTWSAGVPERFRRNDVQPGRFLEAMKAKKRGLQLVA